MKPRSEAYWTELRIDTIELSVERREREKKKHNFQNDKKIITGIIVRVMKNESHQ